MTDINITDEQFYDIIRQECAALADLLINKNKAYGNSILRSPNVFSNTTPLDKIADRLDDKLSRVISGREDDPEDAKLDIAGYLLLERAVRTAMANEGREVLSKPASNEDLVTKAFVDSAVISPAEVQEQVTLEEVPLVEKKPAAKKTRKPAAKKAKKVEAPVVEEIAADLSTELAGLVEVAPTEEALVPVAPSDLLADVAPSEEPVAAEVASGDDGLMGLL